MNRAAELGPKKFSWWQNWWGDPVAIVASGPSTKSTPVTALKDRCRVIGIKENVPQYCMWADVAYGCDGHWWRSKNGLPEFKGLRICYDAVVCDAYKLIRVDVEPTTDRLLVEEPGRIGAGGNSGFQALNLAIQFGASRIMLIGFDASDRSGVHWYGRNGWPGANNPDETNFTRWRKAFDQAAKNCEELGVEVVNLSPNSAIKSFPKMTMEETMERWRL